MSRKKDRVKRPPGKTMVCPLCGYGGEINPITVKPELWVTRVESPKQCPRCKGYIRRGELKVPGLRRMPTIETAPGADKYIAGISGNKNL